jgi:hypothetical protein
MTARREALDAERAVPGLYDLARRRAFHAAHNVERAVAGTHVAEHLVLRNVLAVFRLALLERVAGNKGGAYILLEDCCDRLAEIASDVAAPPIVRREAMECTILVAEELAAFFADQLLDDEADCARERAFDLRARLAPEVMVQ